jgi:hypothetical protein
MKNLTNLFLVVAAILIVLGCGKRFVGTAKENCISPDGSQMALTDMYGTVTVIDAKTGNIVTTKEPERDGQETSWGAAFCTQTNEILSFYPNLVVNLKDNRRIKHQVKGKVFDLIDKDTVFTFSGGELMTDSDGDYARARPRG